MDEVTFVIRLLEDNWSSSASSLVSAGTISANHNATPKFIDVRSIEPQEGRRVDVDSQSVLIVFEDSSSTDYPTILENNAFRPTVYATPADSSSAVEGDADLIRLTSRNEANDRGKRLLGYKIGVELKRFARG